MLAEFPASGTYWIPDPALERKQFEDLLKTGPLAAVHILRPGIAPYAPGNFAVGVLLAFVSTGLIAALLQAAVRGLPSYGQRVGFVTLAGLAAGLYWQMADTFSNGGSWAYFGLMLVLGIAHWCILGLVLAAFIKPRAPAPAADGN